MIESPPDRLAAARHGDFGLEAVDALNEFSGRAGVQALAVDDFHLAKLRAREIGERRAGTALFVEIFAHLAESTLLATVIYLRPASRASITAWSSSDGVAQRRELDQHRQIDAADHLDPAALHRRNRQG